MVVKGKVDEMPNQIRFSNPAIKLARQLDISEALFRLNCNNHFYAGKTQVKNVGDAADENRKLGTLKDAPTQKQDVPNVEVQLKDAVITSVGIDQTTQKKQNVLTDCEPIADAKHDTSSKQINSAIILAVDATPTRVGGLLRLPGKEHTIFYYSIDWSNRFKIVDSTKFEMVNTALALELFEPYVKAYRGRYEKFFVKTDSNFYQSIKRFKDPHDFEFLSNIRNKVKALKGEFQHVFVSQKDADIQNADYLSRTEVDLGLKICYKAKNNPCNGNDTVNYALVNLSDVASKHTLSLICETAPRKYLKT